MNREEYEAFYHALLTAEKAEVHGFDGTQVFEGCMPIEVMAARGEMVMALRPDEARRPRRSPNRARALRRLCSCGAENDDGDDV